MPYRSWPIVVLLALQGLVLAAQPAPDPRRPTPVFDEVAPTLPARLRGGVLIFSKTNGYRHVEQIPHSNAVIDTLARARGLNTFVTENAAIFNPAQLSRFRVIVLNSASGNLFTAGQRAAFVNFIRGGGTLIALHGAGGDADQPWTQYVDEVIGARFTGHPSGPDQFQRATIRRTERSHPVMAGLPASWPWTDELYSFDRVPAGPDTQILATLDERDYRKPPELAMGAVHPMIWTRRLGRGRILFSALGHRPEAYDDPIQRRLLDNALGWAARGAR